MKALWNKEALKAQAVAARTYAVRYKTLTMDDTINYQAYGGYTWNSNSSSAVDETTSQTLMYNGKLIDAFYSASNGGKTESNANVWGGTPLDFYPIKEDPYDTKVPWSFTLKKTQIDTTPLDLANPQNWWNSINEADTSLVSNIKSWMYLNGYANNEIKLTSIPTLSFSDNKTTGGRVKLASINLQFFLKDKTTGKFVMDDQNKLKTNTITYTDTSASKVRAMIGINVIKSYLVTNYQDNGTSYSVSGLGNGHGVGMSQWGAKVMADQGLGYRDILSFYYPGTTLTNTDSIPAATSTVPTITTAPVTTTTTAPDTVTTTVTVPVSTTVTAAAPATNVISPPIISNVSSFYTASAHQIAIDYVLKENVTTTVYVKDSKGTIIGYPIKNRNQIPGKQRITFDVAKVPNGNYTFGITITNKNKLSASAIKNVTVNKLLQAPKITSVSNKDTAVSGTSEAKASITIKVGTKVIGNGKADTKGKFRVSIPKQRTGTTLLITAKDSAGNVSTAAALKVKIRR